MEKFVCLVCNRDMVSRNSLNVKSPYTDVHCNQEDHHLSWRYDDNNITKMRIRFQDEKERLVLKIHYDAGYSEVWSKRQTNNDGKVRLDQIVLLNFEDIDKLKNK